MSGGRTSSRATASTHSSASGRISPLTVPSSSTPSRMRPPRRLARATIAFARSCGARSSRLSSRPLSSPLPTSSRSSSRSTSEPVAEATRLERLATTLEDLLDHFSHPRVVQGAGAPDRQEGHELLAALLHLESGDEVRVRQDRDVRVCGCRARSGATPSAAGAAARCWWTRRCCPGRPRVGRPGGARCRPRGGGAGARWPSDPSTGARWLATGRTRAHPRSAPPGARPGPGSPRARARSALLRRPAAAAGRGARRAGA